MAFITAVVLALRPSEPTAEVLVDAAPVPLELVPLEPVPLEPVPLEPVPLDDPVELEEEPEYPEPDPPE